AAELVEGNEAIGLVALLVGAALEAVEQHLGEDAVVLEVQRGAEAVGGQEGNPAGLGQVVLGAVVAEELLVGGLAEVGLGDGAGPVALVGEALEVDVEEDAELLALEGLEGLLDLLGGDGVLGPVLERGVGGEVAAAIAGLAERAALADERQED